MTDHNITFGKRYLVYLMVFLGMLSAFGPFVTDMYLPVLPQMAEIFNCSASTAQFGLTMSLIGLAAGQLFFGPLSDKYGRKPVLLASLILFAASTIIILFSPTMEWFNICRLFQGIGGAGGIVLSPIHRHRLLLRQRARKDTRHYRRHQRNSSRSLTGHRRYRRHNHRLARHFLGSALHRSHYNCVMLHFPGITS